MDDWCGIGFGGSDAGEFDGIRGFAVVWCGVSAVDGVGFVARGAKRGVCGDGIGEVGVAVGASRGVGEFDQSEGDVVFCGIFPVVFNAVGQSVDVGGDDAACDGD